MSNRRKVIAVILAAVCLVVVYYSMFLLGKISKNRKLCDVPYNDYSGYELVIDGKEIDESTFSVDVLKNVKWYVEKNDKEAKILYITTKKK